MIAWIAGLCAPLGWMAIAVGRAGSVSDRSDPGADTSEPPEVARRLVRHEKLPGWLSACIAHLDLHPEVCRNLGAPEEIVRVMQLAIGLARKHGVDIPVTIGAEPEENAAHLKITPEGLRELEAVVDQSPGERGTKVPRANGPGAPATKVPRANGEHLTADTGDFRPPLAVDPRHVPHLRDLLVLAAANRRLVSGSLAADLESEIEQLHRALREERLATEQRLHERKLRALAEFAAGAGHEINNPLAVISGQAQYLLNHEPDPARQKPLETIIQQTKRIHEVLRDLMQFSRPPRPRKQTVSVGQLIHEAADSLAELAAQRKVQLQCPNGEAALNVFVDPQQVRTAVQCLMRNAIEAAPAEGWARVSVATPAADQLDVVVEDNGDGLEVAQREHLFDPFYSGRQAGRGRGLGLSTAWRLAKEHGGDVRLENNGEGPTRFVLSLPRASDSNGHQAAAAHG